MIHQYPLSFCNMKYVKTYLIASLGRMMIFYRMKIRVYILEHVAKKLNRKVHAMIEKNSFHFKKTKNPYLEKISKICRGMYPFLENFLSGQGKWTYEGEANT